MNAPPVQSGLRFRRPVGDALGGFVVGHHATMNRCAATGTIVDLAEHPGGLVVTLAFAEPQFVDFPDGATSQCFSMRATGVTSTWCDAPAMAGYRLDRLRAIADQVRDAVVTACTPTSDGGYAALEELEDCPEVEHYGGARSHDGAWHALGELVQDDGARFLLWTDSDDVGIDPWPPGVVPGSTSLVTAFEVVASDPRTRGSVALLRGDGEPVPSPIPCLRRAEAWRYA